MTHTIELGHRLGLNENPYGPLPSVHAALERALVAANRYPEFRPDRLPRLIAGRIGVAPERVVVGAGATGVFMTLLQEFVRPGDEVVMATPTFEGFPMLTEMVGGRAVAVPLTAGGCQDLRAMAAAVGARTRLVVICNPHNPTGTRLDPAALSDFLAALDPAVTAVLDEAYLEFVPNGDRLATLDLLDRHPNLVVVRTFSKAFGLAALRIGYAVGLPVTMGRIAHRQVPFAMHALAEVGVRACYDAADELTARVEAIRAESARLGAGLRALGLPVPISSANFAFVFTPDQAVGFGLRNAFAEAGIQVKDYAEGIRVTVGDDAATAAVLTAVRTAIP